MDRIPLPPYDRAFALDQLDFFRTFVSQALAQAREDGELLFRLPRAAIECAGYLVALHPTSPDLPAALKIAGQAWAAMFARITAPTGHVIRAPLGDGPMVEYTSCDPDSTTGPGQWVDAFLCATIVRDNETLARLCTTPLERIREVRARAPEWLFLQVAALQCFWLKEGDFVGRLLQALRATDPDRIRADFAGGRLPVSDIECVVRSALMQEVPWMKLLTRVIQGDVAQFNETLHEALELQRGFALADMADKPDIQDATLFLALGPLAMVSLAMDKGIAVTIESDYLPAALVSSRPLEQPASA